MMMKNKKTAIALAAFMTVAGGANAASLSDVKNDCSQDKDYQYATLSDESGGLKIYGFDVDEKNNAVKNLCVMDFIQYANSAGMCSLAKAEGQTDAEWKAAMKKVCSTGATISVDSSTLQSKNKGFVFTRGK